MRFRRCEWRARVLFEPRDLWIGVYWTTLIGHTLDHGLAIYLCLVPMFPIFISWRPR